MHFPLYYLVIPLVTIITAIAGGWLVSGGMKWYDTIKKPRWTPPGWLISLAWTIIFILSTIGTMMIWTAMPHDGYCCFILGLFIGNALLNVLWSFLFFRLHLLRAAAAEAACLTLDVVLIIILAWSLSVTAALLFLPYALWVAFATFLTYRVAALNEK